MIVASSKDVERNSSTHKGEIPTKKKNKKKAITITITMQQRGPKETKKKNQGRGLEEAVDVYGERSERLSVTSQSFSSL